MSQFGPLFMKEVRLEFRQKHTLGGAALYVLSTVFICYLTFNKIESTEVWGALLWITGIFTSFNAMQKAFAQESGGTTLYLYSLAKPRDIILAKAAYNALLVATLNLASLCFFLLFFGEDVLAKIDLMQFLVGLLLGSSALGITLTFIAGLSFKSGSGSALVAILGFPVIIPLLITIVRFSGHALDGDPWSENSLQILIMSVLNVTSLTLALVLFPYLWRD